MSWLAIAKRSAGIAPTSHHTLIQPRLISEILDSVAHEKDWFIKAKEIASDHVHLLIEYDEKTPICDVVKAFKGRSSKLLREEFPELKKLPSLWTRSYFYDTSGKVSTSNVMAYINDPHHERH